LINNILDKYSIINQHNIIPFYNILSNSVDKYLLLIICYLKYKIIIDTQNIIFDNNMINIIIDNHLLLIKLFFLNYIDLIIIYSKNSVYTNMIKIFTNNYLIHNYIDKVNIYMVPEYVLLYTRFYSNNLQKKHIQINFLLHNLRLFIKYNKNKKQRNHKLYMNNLLHELLNFKPNKKIKILSKGSYLYQLKEQKFMYNENNIKINDIINNTLIYKKCNSILVKNIPFNIFPNNDIFNKYELKAEYIEEKDLYLIIDINVPDTTILERYDILRKLHLYTQNDKLNYIDNINDFDILDNNNNKIIEQFLIEYKNKIVKWFPKFMCYINNNTIIKKNNYISL
jgi:hypothetical protein